MSRGIARVGAAAAALSVMLCTGCGSDAAEGDRAEVDASASDADAPELGACPSTEEVYAGPGVNVRAIEGNPHRPSIHFVAAYVELDDSIDLLNISTYVASGVDVGTFSIPGEGTWTAAICVDRDPDRVPICRDTLWVDRATLEVESVEGRLVGSLTDAVFVDNRDQPSCEVTVIEAPFDAEIECEPEIHCE